MAYFESGGKGLDRRTKLNNFHFQHDFTYVWILFLKSTKAFTKMLTKKAWLVDS